MKQSIRIRLTLIFISLTACLIFVIWGINNWFLEDYYINRKVQDLTEAYTEMNALVMKKNSQGMSISDDFSTGPMMERENESEAAQLIRSLNDRYSIRLLIEDSVKDKTIVSSGRDNMFMVRRARNFIIGQAGENDRILKKTGNYTIQITREGSAENYMLECWGFYEDNTSFFIMSIPLAGIRESVNLTNRFLSVLGLTALALMSIIVLITTTRFTSPILQLTDIAERMSRLEFEAKYSGKAEDEIGKLGNSMNVLSDKLEDTIRQLKDANLELQKDVEEKTRIDEMRQEFIGNVSHELKTPIALIQGYAEGLMEGLAEDKETRDYYCEVIMDEANKMNNMVKQLITLNALESGYDQLSQERFELNSVIEGVLNKTGILIQQKNAKVIFDPKKSVYVWADEFKIEQVLTNYISNALNHIAGDNEIRIWTEAEGERIKVLVHNTGEQIPEASLPYIWNKFYKVDKARTRAYGGSGIGLSIVKAIMDSHKQECGVENTEDGVTFWFTLDH